MVWTRRAKIAFIGSHSVRKTNAVHAFASTVGRAGRAVEMGREVVRDNPLPFNEDTTADAQLWVLMSQVRQELELAHKAEILITDRAVLDNFAYYLRATQSRDPFKIEPFIRRWTGTYDLMVRLRPDVAMKADGVRSTNDVFRDEIETILDRIVPIYVKPARLIELPASRITRTFDWWPVAERLAEITGQTLMDEASADSA